MEESNKNVKIYVIEAIVGDKSRLEQEGMAETIRRNNDQE